MRQLIANRLVLLFTIGLYLAMPTQIFAASSSGSIVDEIFQLDNNGKLLTCGGLVKGKYLSGKVIVIGAITFFKIRNEELKVIRTKLREEKSERLKKNLKSKLGRLSKKIGFENSLCSFGPGGLPPTEVTPTPGQLPTNIPAQPTNTPSVIPTQQPVNTPTSTPTSTPSDSLSASVQRGKIIYDMQCSSCHRLGSYDISGSRDLQGKADNVNPALLQSKFGLVLSNQEVIDIKNFIKSK